MSPDIDNNCRIESKSEVNSKQVIDDWLHIESTWSTTPDIPLRSSVGTIDLAIWLYTVLPTSSKFKSWYQECISGSKDVIDEDEDIGADTEDLTYNPKVSLERKYGPG